MAYIYTPPLTETEKTEMTEEIITDLVYRTGYLTPKEKANYVDRLRDIWSPPIVK